MALYGVSTAEVPKRMKSALQAACASALMGSQGCARAPELAMSLVGFGLMSLDGAICMERIHALRRCIGKRPEIYQKCIDAFEAYSESEADPKPCGPAG
eukprot:15432838-Alexandrium_andersonii.AAC.1